MWVRSQDKLELINVSSFFIGSCRIDNKINFYIRVYISNTDETSVIGEYSTKEKVLKVMNMIEKHITDCQVKVCNGVEKYPLLQNIVFKMPQDGDIN